MQFQILRSISSKQIRSVHFRIKHFSKLRYLEKKRICKGKKTKYSNSNTMVGIKRIKPSSLKLVIIIFYSLIPDLKLCTSLIMCCHTTTKKQSIRNTLKVGLVCLVLQMVCFTIPSRRQSKWRHWRYSLSLIKPFRGVAQPSASTCTHCISTL